MLAYDMGKKKWKGIADDHLQTAADNEFRRVSLENNIDAEVEKRLEERIRSWSPRPEDISADFRTAEQMAEYMAAKREQVNAGRHHPPREDGGAPARVGKIVVRGRAKHSR